LEGGGIETGPEPVNGATEWPSRACPQAVICD
jgi:hypothetical protein